jgi:hypothetical protein
MSFQFTTNAGKTFESAPSGVFHAVLADIADLGLVTSTFQGQTKTQPKVRFVWILENKDKEGKNFRVFQQLTNNLHEKSNLYKTVKQILNAAPPTTLDPETLIGSVRKLFVQQDGQYTNIMGIAPGDPGVTVAIPADFVRDKNKPVEKQAKTKYAAKQAAPAQTQAPALQVAPAAPATQDPAVLLAQLQALQAQLANASTPKQGADVAF